MEEKMNEEETYDALKKLGYSEGEARISIRVEKLNRKEKIMRVGAKATNLLYRMEL